jgi:hypothetical protein
VTEPQPPDDPDTTPAPDTRPGEELPEAPVPVVRKVRRRRSVQRRMRRRRVVRRTVLTGGLVLVVLVGLGVWLSITAYQAKGELEQARGAATAAKAAFLTGDTDTASRQVDRAVEQAGLARSSTSALPWRLLTPVPVLGDPFNTTRQVAAAVDDLAQRVLRPAAQAGAVLNPSALRPSGARIDVVALASAQAPLERASAASTALLQQVAAIPPAGWIGQVDDARSQLLAQTQQLTTLLRDTSTAVTLLPPMLGADGPRTYFLGFQTNAEAAGTGGLLGGFAILKADAGAVSFDTLAANSELMNRPTGALDLGPSYDQTYGQYNPTGVWQNSNESAHFPYAARAWQAMWQRQTGQRVDGAIATDPVALSYILGATGGVTLADGEKVTADNVVQLTEVDAYARFGANLNTERKAFLQQIAQAVVGQVTSGKGSTTALLTALGRAAGEGRLDVWSSTPTEQQVLATTPLAHEVPTDPAPFAGVTVNNYSNGKLDYYLGRTISYQASGCSGQYRTSTVTVTLTNNAPATGLPAYVTTQRRDYPQGPPGTNTANLQLLATNDALARGVSLDGAAAPFVLTSDRGHPALTVLVQLQPGQTRTVVFNLLEPTSATGAARVPAQPLVEPVQITTAVPVCTGPRG